jgi:hypothetical protein
MKKQKWIDATSYRQGERVGQVTPRAWTLGVGHLSQLRVHQHIGDPGAWFLTCIALSIEQRPLLSKDVEGAQSEALVYVAARVKDVVEYYKKLGVQLCVTLQADVEHAMELDYSDFLRELIDEAKSEGAAEKIDLIRSFWGKQCSWEQIQEMAAVEGNTWYVWWMDGVRAYIRYEQALEHSDA